MELPNWQRSNSINPAVVGKIMEYSQDRETFLKELKDCESITIEAYSLILEWYAQSGVELSPEECNLLYDSSMFWGNLEKEYQKIGAECRYHVLKILRICTVINSSCILNLKFESEELRVNGFEMVVQGCLLRKSDQDITLLIEYIISNEIVDLLVGNDNENLRIPILRNLSVILEIVPQNNPVMEKIRKYLISAQDICILEILLFLLKPLLKTSMEDIHKLIPEVIYRGCESTDESVRKNALFSLKNYIDFLQNSSGAKEEENLSFRYLITILSSVEQNQSHLICPAIKMLPRTEEVPVKWQKLLLRSCLRTQNKLILQSVLDYLILREDFNLLIGDLLPNAFLALNQNTIHREGSEICEKFSRKAFRWNWRASFKEFAEVSWLAFPLYSILTYITKEDEYLGDFVDGAGLMFRKIVGNIYSLQMDHLTKRGIILLLLKFVKKVEKSLKDEDRTIILRRIIEGSPKDQKFLKTCRDSLNCKSLSSETSRDLLKEFNGNILEILDYANDLDERDFMKLSELIDKENCEIIEEKSAELLNKFQGCSFKEKFVTLLILKSGVKHPSSDIWKDFINCNFVRNEIPTCSRELKLLYEKVLFELVLQVIHQFWNFPDGAQPVDFDLILEIIGRRLECGEDFCNTMFLFKFLYFYNISQKQRTIVERLLDLSYKEMMAYRGKSQFSLYCSSFIECFPATDIPISITLEKLLQDISLNSPEITNAIAEKLPFLNLELLANLLVSREGVDASFIMKNSPLRDLQFEIVDFVVNSKKYKSVLGELLKKYDALSKTKAMYYPNSHHHLTKLRIVQGIAAIVHHTNIWRSEYLEFLLNEANQPSIIYILELIVAQTIPDETIFRLTEMLKSVNNLKMHSAQSIFCILYLLCRKKNSPDFCRTCFDAIYPWTMGQNFSCRLYAQIAILKIHKLLTDTQSQPQEKYITKSLLFSFYELSGNPEKNMERFENDFRFNCLNESYLLSPTYIFRDIPRITGVAETEIVSYCNGEEDLKTIVHPWQQKQAPGVTSVQETYDNIQTKIVPPEEFGHDDERKSSGLIVCASLVDNYPNLGGLARTCEIFGVQKFILNSLRDAENSQFLALSMSAEKWLMLEEVKKWQLIDFCAEMKRQGYTIVGAEQTPRSIRLPEVRFPEKSLLVLG